MQQMTVEMILLVNNTDNRVKSILCKMISLYKSIYKKGLSLYKDKE